MLAVVDAVADEFVPSLRARTSTTQADLAPGAAAGTCDAYVTAMLAQHCAVVPDDDGAGLRAVLSARTSDHPLEDEVPGAVYLSTVAVAPWARRQGLAALLLDAMLTRFAGRPALSRTWSTNTASIRLHERAGFAVHARVRDDRGPGVDTVYLLRPA